MLTAITVIGILLAPGVACIVVPYFILKAAQIPFAQPTGILQIAAIGIAGLGVYLILWVSSAFVRQGSGTPVPVEPPKSLVISGLYRYVRNPMYVGAVLIVLAEAAYFGSWQLALYAAGLWAILHTALVVYEEPQLKQRFGEEYQRYTAEVPRWIPKLTAQHTPEP